MVMEPISPAPGCAPSGAPSTSLSSGAPGSAPQFNPQSLGREFVRQYYTVLNQGPQILHRFYSDDSSFIHGALNKPGEVIDPVYGQTEINSKIMSLSFKDCHAKIRQVDSLETVGKGVVVQVTGELSNDGEPMRRFFQTFVLAPRSPTNYYVRNDIFRYQDEVFNDEDEYSETDKGDNESEKLEPQVTAQMPSEKVEMPVKDSARFEPVNVNGDIHVVAEPEKMVESDIEISSGSKAAAVPPEDDDWNTEPAEEETPAGPAESGPGSVGTASPPPSHSFPNEPQTYATMVSKNPTFAPPFSNAPSTFATKPSEGANAMAMLGAPFVKPAAVVVAAETSPIPGSVGLIPAVTPTAPVASPTGPPSGGKPPANAQLQREQRPGRPRNQGMGKGRSDTRETTPGRGDNDSSYGDEARGGEFPARRAQFADEMQVFVGNLPQDITEDQLKLFFARFGTIVDVRINRTNQKSGTGRTPNYGFVTFDDPKVVKIILGQKPIYFNEHRFNVEEKRSQGVRGSLSRSGSGASQLGPMGGRGLNSSTSNIPGGNRGPSERGGGGGGQQRGGPRGERHQNFGGNESGRRSGGGGGGGGRDRDRDREGGGGRPYNRDRR